MTLNEMRSFVFEKKPAFAEFFRQYQNVSVAAYYEHLGADYAPTNLPQARRRQIVNTIVSYGAERLGLLTAFKLRKYFTKRFLVSTAAHHDPATHPFFSNYLIAAGYANTKNRFYTVPVLSCAGVSFNNSSLPRALLVHDRSGKEQRIILESLKKSQRPVYGHKAMDRAAADKARESVARLDIAKEERTRLMRALDVSFFKQASRFISFASQISAGIQALYRLIPGLKRTSVVYLPQEGIAATLLIKYHLGKRTIFDAILCDKQTRSLFLKEFDGIIGAHNSTTGGGTHLFWGIVNDKRVALSVKEGKLISSDGVFSIPLDKKSLTKALKDKSLMPAMSLTLPLISFYYGLACAGGFSQIGYLAEMKTAYLRILNQVPCEADDVKIAAAVPTHYFAGEFIAITLDASTPATPLDIVKAVPEKQETEISKTLSETSLGTAIDRMIPELYRIVAPSL